jgi:hypothetical protein
MNGRHEQRALLRVAFLTMQDEGDFVTDYRPAIAPLESLGWQVDCVPWRQPGIAWDRYDAVYIGAPWDYTDDPADFLRVLETIDRSRAVLVNPLALVYWNLDKSYLRDLEGGGAAIVPSRWYESWAADVPAECRRAFAADRLVIKPRVGANARDTFVLEPPLDAALDGKLARLFAGRAFLVQPFIESIRHVGEFSLFYIGGELSHAIQKLPKAGDFRVQEEHGAAILPARADAALCAAGERVLSLVAPSPVYARVDFVRHDDGTCLLMELELVEPSLYLRMDADAPLRFARAFDTHVRFPGGPRGA